MMMWAKAVTTGPLDRHVLELQRREDRDPEEGHTSGGSDINYLPCSELRPDEGLGKREMINDGSDIDYLPCSELSLVLKLALTKDLVPHAMGSTQ